VSKKFVLPKDVQEWLDGQSVTGHGRKNVYTCDTCLGEVVTIDTDKGVTPFMIFCRATPRCKGFMKSSFYHCDPARVATFEWYRPETIEGLARESKEHVRKGGLLLRPMPRISSDVAHDA
jgi:hypothetical protein